MKITPMRHFQTDIGAIGPNVPIREKAPSGISPAGAARDAARGGYMSDGKVTIFTGSGHGKTPAALGTGLQYASAGKKVVVIEFLKGKGLKNSDFIRRLEPDIKLFRFEKSTKPFSEMTEAERSDDIVNMRNGLHFAGKVLDTAECDLLIMDEVLGLVDNKIITVEDLQDLVSRRGETDVILTGIAMDTRVCAFADEISEIHTVHFKNYR